MLTVLLYIGIGDHGDPFKTACMLVPTQSTSSILTILMEEVGSANFHRPNAVPTFSFLLRFLILKKRDLHFPFKQIPNKLSGKTVRVPHFFPLQA